MASKAAATRKRILDGATSLFWRRSYHTVAMDVLAEETGVNKATIYRYFPDKAALAQEVARRNGEQVLNFIFAPIFAQYSKPDERLAALYRFAHAVLTQIHAVEGDLYGCPIASLSLELGHELPEVRRETVATFDGMRKYFLDIALDAIDGGTVTGWSADGIARTLLQIMHGALVDTHLASHPDPFLGAGDASLMLIGSPIRLGENAVAS